MGEIDVDDGRILDIAARLRLREPNREALESLARAVSMHFDVDNGAVPYECVIDVATGVGKTYIMAATIEYYAAAGHRHIAIVAPGATIRDKTIANFTPGHPKSILHGMESRVEVVHAGNFDRSSTVTAMQDDTVTKVYIFTVQSILKPTKADRRTHTYQENFGAGFYATLAQLADLIVLADEYHCYAGKSFAKAIHELDPWLIVGLTATPLKTTPEEQIVYRYPLSAAIADRLVKTPVIVARRDDRTDTEAKLADGLNLLTRKQEVADTWASGNDRPPVNCLMLVIAQTIDDANEWSELLESPTFQSGRWIGKVLTVHSDKPDAALEALDHVEAPDSPYRVIVSVGMLKEGWDVKTVYVLCSTRALVSEILTEQTLGRGLRLPWGEYTDIELLDTLEVVAHEKYTELLKKKDVLNQAFIDWKTRLVLRRLADGTQVATPERSVVQPDSTSTVPISGTTDPVEPSAGFAIATPDAREAAAPATSTPKQYEPLPAMPAIMLPQVAMKPVTQNFSLADITGLRSFRELGEELAADPDTKLRRTAISAVIKTDPNGVRRTELVTSAAVDPITSAQSLFPIDDLRRQLEDHILNMPFANGRRKERLALQPILDAFISGFGANAEGLLSAYIDRAVARLAARILEEQRRHEARPQFEAVVSLAPISGVRTKDFPESKAPHGKFVRRMAYNTWKRSIYPYNWFDSSTERDAALCFDDSELVKCWVRLVTGDHTVVWRNNRNYNADFIVVETNGEHWVVEVKADDQIKAEEVVEKRNAAMTWVNHVNTAEEVDHRWHYLLVTETDVAQAKGSWTALKAKERT